LYSSAFFCLSVCLFIPTPPHPTTTTERDFEKQIDLARKAPDDAAEADGEDLTEEDRALKVCVYLSVCLSSVLLLLLLLLLG